MSVIFINPYRFAALSGPTDPNFSSVRLLLHGEGTNGSTAIIDSSSSPIDPIYRVNATINTSQKKEGSSSIFFSGSTPTPASRIYYNNPKLIIGSGDFTIEGWFYVITGRHLLFQYATSVSSNAPNGSLGGIAVLDENGKYEMYHSANSSVISNVSTALNTWRHIAVQRIGSTQSLYVNGSLAVSVTTSFNYTYSSLFLGMVYGAFFPMNGYIDEFRVTVGVARYPSGGFTPPSAPFPDS